MLVKPFGPSVTFQLTIPFTGGYPLVRVNLLTLSGQWRAFPLLLDTGATNITIRPEHAQLFPPGVTEGLNAVGQKVPRQVSVTKSRFEFLGQVGDCHIVIDDLPAHPLIAGLFGRECFTLFGFGFWETAREIYVTSQP